MSERSVKVRTVFSAVVMSVVMSLLLARLVYLHMIVSDTVREKFDRKRTIEKKITAERGRIFDCRGSENILALNLELKNLCVDPDSLIRSNKLSSAAEDLATVLGTDSSILASAMNKPGKSYVCVMKGLSDENAEKIRDKKIPGVFFEKANVRNYPHNSLMCHVLGFVNYDGIGSLGIEQQFNSKLNGEDGILKTSVDARRVEVFLQREKYRPAVSGNDVYLTIDQNIQFCVEQALDDLYAQHSAKGAWVIVQRVKTGEILAMASRPYFDPNMYTSASDEQRRNRPISYNYEPGSTFKVIAIAAALQEGTVTPNTMFDCENGAWSFKGRRLRDYHAYSCLSVADGLQKSSNILTAKVALTLGDKMLYKYLKLFGIGERTGIDIPGEEGGMLSDYTKWTGISISRISIGQGVMVTALQQLSVYNTIANDGMVVRPHLVSKVVAPNGQVVYQAATKEVRQALKPETAQLMKRLLSRVTEEGGTGLKAGVKGFDIAGKTGTAQKVINGKYSETAYTASFVGFLPAAEPEVSMIVVVDEPQPIHTGGQVAAPAFGKIANQLVKYLEIIPDSPTVAKAE